MRRARRIAAGVLVFVAGMATMVAFQATTASTFPVDFDGNVHPLFAFAGVVYPIAVLAIGGLAALLYVE